MKTMVWSIFLALGLVLPLTTGLLRADILDSWHWRNPTPFSDTMQDICFGNGKFVAVGAGGLIHTSSDGNSWDSGQRPVSAALHRVIYTNGLFIAVGDNGAIVTSGNGFNWTPQTSGTTNNLFTVAAGNGIYLACGANGQIVKSANGSSWTTGSAGNSSINWLTFGNGVFIAQDQSQSMSVQVSSDGSNWTTETIPDIMSFPSPDSLIQVEFGNGLFFAMVQDNIQVADDIVLPCVHLFQSPDGIHWTMGVPLWPPSTLALNFLTFANGSFYMYTSLGFFNASDSSSYTNTSVPQNASDVHYMAYGNGTYVLIGDNGSSWFSPDTTNWASTFGGTQYTIQRTISGADKIVVLANSTTVLNSSDGIHFNPSIIVPATNFPVSIVNDIAFDGTNYVVAGVSSSGVNSGQIYTSTNATVWVARTSNSNQRLNSVCRGTDRWVAVGNNGTVISSPNTLAWTLRTSGTANNLSGVAYGNGTYVAVGNGGTIISSPDGATWDVQYSGTVSSLNCVRFFNGQFIAVGNGGTIITSPDGANWSSANSGTTASLISVSYGNGRYVACGSGLLLASSDSVNWQDVSAKLPTVTSPVSIDFVNQSFWIGGVSGMLLQSDSADEVPRLAGNMLPGNHGFQLSVPINVPPTYRIQFSTNFESWQDIAFLTNGLSPSTWTDTNALKLPYGFYRIAAP